jgi:hypothetical protein
MPWHAGVCGFSSRIVMSSMSRDRSPGRAPTALTAFLKEDSDNWGRIIAKAGIQIV